MYVVLVGIEYEGNLGMIARLCENFNAKMVLVSPKAKVNFESKKWARHAKGVLEKARVYTSLSEVKKDIKVLVGTTAKTAGQYNVKRSLILPEEVVRTDDMGLVFGRESSGLTNEEVEICDILVNIPTSKKYKSINISNAVAIMLYQVKRMPIRRKLADRKVRDQAMKFWEELLIETNYTQDKQKIQAQMFKRVTEKATLNEREAYGIAGVLGRILKKIKNLKKGS